MNPLSVGLVSIVGLLAVYLYVNQSSSVSDKQSESQAELRCRSAKFDADFARKWNDKPERIKQLEESEEKECGAFQASRETSSTEGVERSKDMKDLQNTIGNMMK